MRMAAGIQRPAAAAGAAAASGLAATCFGAAYSVAAGLFGRGVLIRLFLVLSPAPAARLGLGSVGRAASPGAASGRPALRGASLCRGLIGLGGGVIGLGVLATSFSLGLLASDGDLSARLVGDLDPLGEQICRLGPEHVGNDRSELARTRQLTGELVRRDP